MIDYKLAKQLKDVGYPQKGRDMWVKMNSDGKHKVFPNVPDYVGLSVAKKVCVAPILSELIEVCGDSFFSLIKMKGGLWEADFTLSTNNTDQSHIVGKSPEEAVAKLYLKLNKKNDHQS